MNDPLLKFAPLVEFGLPASVVLTLQEVFGGKELSTEDRRFAAGPLVVHQSSWNDTRPPWMAGQAKVERIAIVFGEKPEWIVGPTEIACAMYGPSLDAPLQHDYAELYIWATMHAAARHQGKTVAQLAAELHTEVMPDEKVLDPQERSNIARAYRQLAHDIRRRVIARGAEAERAEKREAKAKKATTSVPPSSPPARMQVVQTDLFGAMTL